MTYEISTFKVLLQVEPSCVYIWRDENLPPLCVIPQGFFDTITINADRAALGPFTALSLKSNGTLSLVQQRAIDNSWALKYNRSIIQDTKDHDDDSEDT